MADVKAENVGNEGGFGLNKNGYLIKTSKIARVGVMDYWGSHLGLANVDPEKNYRVEVRAKDLFTPSAIRSFEGMPVTLLHPENGVHSENWKDVTIGHIQNVRQSGEFLLADVYVTDSNAIKTIRDLGMKELSLGYDCCLVKSDRVDFYKTNIVGNHCAIVPSGRAGERVCLGDRSNGLMNKKWLSRLGRVFSERDAYLVDAAADSEASVDENNDVFGEILASLQSLAAMVDGLADDVAIKADLIEGIQSLLGLFDADSDDDNEDEDGKEEAVTDGANVKKSHDDLVNENLALKRKLALLKDAKQAAVVLADAKVRFPRLKLQDAQSCREVYSAVLNDGGVFSAKDLKLMSDMEIKAAYAAHVASSGKKSQVGRVLLGDGRANGRVSASKRLGGR